MEKLGEGAYMYNINTQSYMHMLKFSFPSIHVLYMYMYMCIYTVNAKKTGRDFILNMADSS